MRVNAPLLASWEPCSTVGCPCPNHRLPCYSVGEPDNFNNDPHFCHLTLTNNIPLHAEEVAISSMITDLEANVASINATEDKLKVVQKAYTAQLEAIDLQLRTLADERVRLSDAIRQRRFILNPVRRVPLEILQRIFMDSIQFPASWSFVEPESRRERAWYTFVEEGNDLWTFELVCKRWNVAVLGDPALWSFFDIVVSDENFNDGITRYISRLVRQMTRAQLCPLSVTIRRCSSFTSDKLPSQLPMLLLPNSYRIHELFLHLPIPLISGLSPLKKHMQALARLNIINTPFYGNGANPMVFDECPQLNFICTTDIISPSRSFVLPWSQIQSYTSRHALLAHGEFSPGPRPRSLRSILEKATNLRECDLSMEMSSPNFTPNPLTCHHLVDLTIVIMENLDFDVHPLLQLFGNLTLPSLEYLEIKGRKGREIKAIEPNTIFTCVVDVIERSQCPLQYLEYPDGTIMSEDLVRIVNAGPPLECLELERVGWSDEPVNLSGFFHALASERNDVAVLPVLDTLVLSGQFEFEANELLDMLEIRSARWPFKRITLEWISSDTVSETRVEADVAAILKGVEKYRAAGLIFRANAHKF